MGYEGHCVLEPDRQIRVTKHAKAMAELFDVVDHLAVDGIECAIMSRRGAAMPSASGDRPIQAAVERDWSGQRRLQVPLGEILKSLTCGNCRNSRDRPSVL